MLQATIVSKEAELQQILELQHQNLLQNIPGDEMQSQGFVTMQHSYETLYQMHQLAPSIIVKDADRVIGYALVMLRECRQFYPPLEPMFAVFDTMHWNDKPLHQFSFYAMGQVCIHKQYRGQGVFEKLYHKHREIYQPTFDCILTEVATRNHRSMRAHERVGFKTLHTYRDALDEWAVVLWDWKDPV